MNKKTAIETIVVVFWLFVLLFFAQIVKADESKIMFNGKEAALMRIYTKPDQSVRYIKVVTRGQLDMCLAPYPESRRTNSRYINFCLCKLSYGKSKCNL